MESYLDWDGDDGEGGFVECEVCADSEYDDPPTLPPPHVVILPIHCHGSACHADHVCGADEVGGGDQDCEPCGPGLVPNESGVCAVCEHGELEPGGQCAVPYKVARCKRKLEDTPLAVVLLRHPNVLVQDKDGSETQRGFFPQNESLAVFYAQLYLAMKAASVIHPFAPDPVVIYVPSKVEEDPIQGKCRYTEVEKQRYKEVEDRMLRSVNTRPPWHEYHAIKRNSIDWADEVLK